MYKKILIGVDDSEHSRRVVQKALERAKTSGAKVVAFHSVLHNIAEMNMSFYPSSIGSPTAGYTLHQDFVHSGQRAIKMAEELFKKENQEIETRLVYDVPPENYVKKAVKEEEFDLVILGSAGHHNALERMVLGTVPEHVLNEVPCDVLIVK